MSEYKVGDKVVIKITGVSKYGESYEVADTSMWNTIRTERVTEPLSTYTKPLESKIRRQAAEITRLLAENERLKPNYENIRAVGQNEAWELARKIILNNGYSIHDLYEIFDSNDSYHALENYTYQEAAAKVAEWEKAKEEIKVGDVLEDMYDSNVKCIVTNLYPNDRAYLVFDDGTAGMHELNNFKKTSRHIDIDSFLKQIGGEK